MLPALIILGLGFGQIIAPAINTATSRVAFHDAGIASAMVNTMQQVGGSIGTAVLSTVAASATATYVASRDAAPGLAAAAATHGYTIAFIVAAVLLGLGALATILIMPGKQVHQRRLADHHEEMMAAMAKGEAAPAPVPVAAH